MHGEASSAHGGIYHVRFRGRVDAEFLAGFEGLIQIADGDGVTRLVGNLQDQSALHGVLPGIRERGWPLLLVAAADCPCPKSRCERRDLCPECQAYHALKGKQPYCLRPGTSWDKALRRLA
jgi:hypothetical protein